MIKIRNILFIIAGIAGLFVQALGAYIILWLVGAITKYWMTVIGIAVYITIIDIWKHYYFKRKGMKPTISQYK